MTIPETMHAMVLEAPKQPLRYREVSVPRPGLEQVLIRIHACGVCRTDLHVADGDLAGPKLPLILGHEIVGHVVHTSEHITRFKVGDRVGVPWLGYTDGDAGTAGGIRRVYAITPYSPVILWTAAMPSIRWPMKNTAFICRTLTVMPKPRRCCVRA